MSETTKEPKEFLAYAAGMCYVSVCSSLPVEEATARLNREYPTGIESKWSHSAESFRGGTPNPCPCRDFPDTHQHYLFA